MMTKAEFKNKYGVAFGTVEKTLNEMYAEKNEEVGEYVEMMDDVVKCYGMGDFRPTGEYRKVRRWMVNEEATKAKREQGEKAIAAYLATFNGDFEKIREAKRNEAKAKRYIKEIEELEKELAYKKAWLEKNWN